MSNTVGIISSPYSLGTNIGLGTPLSIQQQLLVLLKRSLKRADLLKLPSLLAFDHLSLAKFDLKVWSVLLFGHLSLLVLSEDLFNTLPCLSSISYPSMHTSVLVIWIFDKLQTYSIVVTVFILLLLWHQSFDLDKTRYNLRIYSVCLDHLYLSIIFFWL